MAWNIYYTHTLLDGVHWDSLSLWSMMWDLAGESQRLGVGITWRLIHSSSDGSSYLRLWLSLFKAFLSPLCSLGWAPREASWERARQKPRHPGIAPAAFHHLKRSRSLQIHGEENRLDSWCRWQGFGIAIWDQKSCSATSGKYSLPQYVNRL